MGDASWRFRTTKGDVTIRRDTIGIRSTPTLFLRGQYSGFLHGSPLQRAKIVFNVGAFLTIPLTVALTLQRLFETGTEWLALVYVVSLAFFLHGIWTQYLRETTIALSAVKDVTLNEDERTLTIAHEASGGFFSLFQDDEQKRAHTLRVAEDVRDAKEILRLRGIDYDEPTQTETTYRVRTREGVCFCERCDSQVSPSDRVCPACEYALRVETATTS